MSQQAPQSPSGAVVLGYRWLAALFAALVVIQAFLGTRGVFADPDLITMHEMLANAMFLMIVVQTVLSWMLYSRKAIGAAEVGINAALVLLTSAQIGLGYSTRGDSFVTTVSLHIPLGVLLMGLTCVVATMAWRVRVQPGTTGHSATS
ncbi:MAG: hypothetical protein M3412_02550 [Chloroflexota bacterium]|nr:hypothetical protein [Chloroflexota bacterium]